MGLIPPKRLKEVAKNTFLMGATLQQQELLTPATATPALAGDPGCALAFGERNLHKCSFINAT